MPEGEVRNSPIGRIIAVDLDDVLCWRPDTYEHEGVKKYGRCVPIRKNIDAVNYLFDKGDYIIIYTARGMNQFNGDVKMVHKHLFDFTETQLKQWGIKFHKLVMGKIHYDVIVDDKAVTEEDMWKL